MIYIGINNLHITKDYLYTYRYIMTICTFGLDIYNKICTRHGGSLMSQVSNGHLMCIFFSYKYFFFYDILFSIFCRNYIELIYIINDQNLVHSIHIFFLLKYYEKQINTGAFEYNN